MAKHFYPIGTPGKVWGDEEKASWLAHAGVVKRSYADEVLAKLEPLKKKFEVEQYGALSQDKERYPLFVVKTHGFDAGNGKPCVLVTGGTHGYETSGVQGALLFAAKEMKKYGNKFNIAVCPCVSPWSYECIQRWNPKTIDPNRNYVANSPAEECAAVVDLVAALGVQQWMMHLDLHETTDTDSSEFMPALSSREGKAHEEETIPDGFYLMGNVDNPKPEWHKAMIDAVRKVTHIAPADSDGKIMGLPVEQEGVVNSKSPGKGKGVTNASFAVTTEVYPDSKVTPVTGEQCNRAQAACVVAGLEYLIANVVVTPLRKPTFTKVKNINPASKGANLIVKCIKAPVAVKEGNDTLKEAVLGDDTGVVTVSLRSDDHAALCKVGDSLRVQNAHARMVKGFIRLDVDKWASLKAAEPGMIDFDAVDEKNDISATEYELRN
eukprot:TRINITY_DN80466_c0_g1_i1.p1 TRINITY_DN80466_c0_g1~~TRINITY_DN80466_c0_g1_i1.p1  ORF type:complete len:436 (+),score=73.24 TRINITY_DN80466_c0_g1_i1:58-1365(+)